MVNNEPLRILVKLPVKLGDTIMAAYFLRAVKEFYPGSRLDVIVVKGLVDLFSFMPYVDGIHEFSKQEYHGPYGNIKYGRSIASKEKYDLFFCLPFSFSSALAGFFTKSKKRIGYKKEHRGFLFTHPVKRPARLHIVEEFNYLLENYTGKRIEFKPLNFKTSKFSSFNLSSKNNLVLNVKSGPPSRSIPTGKAISIVRSLLDAFPDDILLTGSPIEEEYISQVKHAYLNEERVKNLAGKTNLLELAYVISESRCMVTTDSGNAHIANAVGAPTVVLFGAAHPHRAKPFDQSISKILKLHDLECVPCESEQCKFKDNRCLINIKNEDIIKALEELISRDT